jgi:excisionase family DNA binding protein
MMDDPIELGRVDRTWKDIEESGHNVYRTEDEEPDDPLRLLSHSRAHAHDRAHVDLLQDEYTPEEAARLLGTSIEVIIHAAREGELKAERAGHKIVCIQHADLVDWLKRRDSGA